MMKFIEKIYIVVFLKKTGIFKYANILSFLVNINVISVR